MLLWGERGERGGPILLILAFRFTKVAVGSFGGLFFVFYNILWYSKVFTSWIFFFFLNFIVP